MIAWGSQPGPGSPLGDSAERALSMIGTNMKLNPRQKEEIRLAWLQYCKALGSFSNRLKHLAANTAALEKVPIAQNSALLDGLSDDLTQLSIANCAQNLLALAKNASIVGDAPQRLGIAYTR